MIDWSFIFSCVTAGTAVVALCLTLLQLHYSNRQSLFSRRVDTLLDIRNLFELTKNNRDHLLERRDGPDFSNGLKFLWLTNSELLSDASPAIDHLLEANHQSALLRKLEELKCLSLQTELLFRGSTALRTSKFIDAYQSLLMIMYQYQIMLQELKKTSSQFNLTLEEAIERTGETSIREQLYERQDNLCTAFDALEARNDLRKLSQQTKLFRLESSK